MDYWTFDIDEKAPSHSSTDHPHHHYPQDLVKRLTLTPPEAKAVGSTYNVAGINALVMYIGCIAKPGSSPMEKSPGGSGTLVPGPAMVRGRGTLGGGGGGAFLMLDLYIGSSWGEGLAQPPLCTVSP